MPHRLLFLSHPPRQAWPAVAFCVATCLAGAHTHAQDAAAPDAAKAAAPAAAEQCEVVVMNLQARGLPKEQEYVTDILTSTLAGEIAAAKGCKVITQSDIKSMLDFEATKAACGETSDSCMAEIGSALGVDLVVGGIVGKLGDSFTFQANLRDVTKGEVIARADETIKGDPILLKWAAKNAAHTLFKLEPVPMPTNAATTTAATGATPEAGAEAGGSNALLYTVIGASVMGTGLTFLVLGGGAAYWANDTLVSNPPSTSAKNEIPLEQWVGLGGLAVAGVGVVATVVGGGVGIMGVLE